MKKTFTAFLMCAVVTAAVAQQGSWHWQAAFANTTLSEVRFTDTLQGFAFGDGDNGGVIMKTNDGGDTWSDVSPAAPDARFWSAWFVDAQHGHAVGRNNGGGAVARTQDGGNTWSVNTSIASERLLGVAFNDLNNGFACGRNGYGLRTTDGGNTWQPFSFGTGNDITALYFFAPNKGLVVGDAGFIKMTQDGGATWNAITVPSTDNFNAIYFTDADNGRIAGDPGVLMQTTDGGATWTLVNTGTNTPLLDVTAINQTKAWTGGENGVLKTTNNGIVWANDTTLTTAIVTGLHAQGNHAWLVTEDGNVFKWTNRFTNDTTGTVDTTELGDTTALATVARSAATKALCFFEGHRLVLRNAPSNATTADVYDALGKIESTVTLHDGSARVDILNLANGLGVVVMRDKQGNVLTTAKALRY